MLLLVSQSLTSWVSQQALSKLSAALPANIELLCTGSSMKFVSISETLALGQLVYVELPEQTQQHADFWCDGANAIFDHDQYDSTASAHNASQRYAALLQRRLQQPYTAFAYINAQPRSPPLPLV
jgi:hypothetical protein